MCDCQPVDTFGCHVKPSHCRVLYSKHEASALHAGNVQQEALNSSCMSTSFLQNTDAAAEPPRRLLSLLLP